MSSRTLSPLQASNTARHSGKGAGVGVAANASVSAASRHSEKAVLITLGYHLDKRKLRTGAGSDGVRIALSELPWGLMDRQLGRQPGAVGRAWLPPLALAWMAGFCLSRPGHVRPAVCGPGLLLVGLLGGQSVNGSAAAR